jgi:hypothetical protein
MNPSLNYPTGSTFGRDLSGNNLYYFDLSSNINYNDISNSNFITNYKNFNVSTKIANNIDTNICAFITPIGFPYVTNIPSGLWIMNLYSYISDTSGSVFYYFSVYKNTTSSLIATSSFSRDVNGSITSTPYDIYTMILPFPDTPMTVTDRLLITITAKSLNTTTPTFPTLNTMFEGSNYSFVTTSLNSGTKLLSSNNNWSGQNNFSNINVPYVVASESSISNLSVTNASIFNFSTSNASIFNIRLSNPITTTDGTYTSSTKVIPYNTVASTGGQIAIGSTAGTTTQGTSAVAIGLNAGNFSQGANSIAIGNNAGKGLSGTNFQGERSVAIGNFAGQTAQRANSVAIGDYAGNYEQAAFSTAVGAGSGNSNQGTNATAVGVAAGNITQGERSVAIGSEAGQYTQGTLSVAVGSGAGNTNQRTNAVAVGNNAGNNTQSMVAVAVGNHAGQTIQGASSIAIGNYAGNNTQLGNAIAIGAQAGQTTQGFSSVAIGNFAGNNTQSDNAVAIGSQAGQTTQGANSVAIGNNAGKTTQTSGSIAIGLNAGQTSQGENAIAIGNNAGVASQTAGSICLNATGVALNPNQAGCFINPIRNGVLGSTFNPPLPANTIYYDTTTFELLKTTTSGSDAFTITSIGGCFINTPTTNISSTTTNISGTTCNISSTGTNTITGTTTNISSTTTNISGTDCNISSTGTTTIRGTNCNISCATTNISSTTTNISGNDNNISSRVTTTIRGPTTNISSSTTNISGTDCNISSTGITTIRGTTLNISSNNVNISSSGNFSVVSNLSNVAYSPSYYMYNRAGTINRTTIFGTKSLVETYYLQPTNLAQESAKITVESYTTETKADYIIDAGIVNVKCSRWFNVDAPFTQINGPIFPTYSVSSNLAAIGGTRGYVFLGPEVAGITTTARVALHGSSTIPPGIYIFSYKFDMYSNNSTGSFRCALEIAGIVNHSAFNEIGTFSSRAVGDFIVSSTIPLFLTSELTLKTFANISVISGSFNLKGDYFNCFITRLG